MKMFITGSKGFVGTNLLEQIGNKHEIVECDLPHCNILGSLEYLAKKMDGCDIVIHLAALGKVSESFKKPHDYFTVNVMGTINILEAMRLKKIRRLIYISSCGVKRLERNDSVPNPYHYSKHLTEQVCEMYSKIYGIEVVILRPTIMYGPYNQKNVVSIFIKLTKKGTPLKIHGDGSQTRDFTHVHDTCNAIIKAVEIEIDFSQFETKVLRVEIGTGRPTSIKQLAEMISDNIQYIPSEKIGVSSSIADIRDAKRYLGWKPKIKIKDGIKKLLKSDG